ncbi:MAG: asparagine--tRNA ligase [Treponema sp.]|jgi:asparaginyl-tRNA synthetase|nr:asparagine--tRNA ligase [Treponema sp.]
MRPLVKEILALSPESQEVTVQGWVKTKRETKNLVFLDVNDGSCFAGIQCTFNRLETEADPALSGISTGASVKIWGRLVPSPASGQAVEIAAAGMEVLGGAPPESYPLQKKKHSFEFLREIAHLRARTNTFAAIARVRSRMAMAVHEFFQSRGFFYINTPIITASDAEGAGAMFQVSTLDTEALLKSGKAPDYTKDFFGKRAYLTVSGQLEAETYACAVGRVYTFGPTFRAENSNTVRHLAEFWMIEPEMAFARLEDNMDLAEDFLKFIFKTALHDCESDLKFFDERIEHGIRDVLISVAESRFSRISYTDAVRELEKNAGAFEFKPYWGCDLQSEHERFLTEKVAEGPVIVTDYPKDIKAFYMKLNDDGKTVGAMDVLVPRLGEIIGGSERENDLSRLEERMRSLNMESDHYEWYLDLRRYGTVPHAGFGLGFERLIQYITGMANIRDVIPYPRAVGQAEF